MRRRLDPGQFLVGLLLKLVLDRLGVRGSGAVVPAAVAAGPASRGTPSSADRPRPSVRRRPLLLFMLGCLGLGMLVMLVFEHWVFRVIGVTTLFAFIVSGVFLIADPAFLAADDDGD
jgi:hypothetical protein